MTEPTYELVRPRQVCVNPPLDARGTIAAVAEAHGWIRDSKRSNLLVDYYRKGRRVVYVYYTLRGSVQDASVTSAAGKNRVVLGRGKRDKLVEELAR